MIEKTKDSMRNQVSVVSEEINRIISQINDISRSVIADPTVQNVVYSCSLETSNSSDLVRMRGDMSSILGTYCLLRNEINSVYISTNAGPEFSYQKRSCCSPDCFFLKSDDCYRIKGRAFWFLADKDIGIITVGRQINRTYFTIPLGLSFLSINESYLSDVYTDLTETTSGIIYIYDQNGYIVSSNVKCMLGELLPSDYTFLSTDDITIMYDGKQKQAVYQENLSANGWTMALIMPFSYYKRDLNDYRNTIIISIIVFLAFGLILLRIMTKKAMLPLDKLHSAMVTFGEGDFSVRCDIDSDDEFGQLSSIFNTMAHNIGQLHSTVYDQQLQLQEAKLRSLQMQINPHFLYNTLDTVKWLAEFKNVPEISDISVSLASLMRYALVKDSRSTIGAELDNIAAYLQIQCFRYSDRLTVIYEIDDSLRSVAVPRLILQPIVENSILHGIEKKLTNGHIIIRCRLNDTGSIELEVEDDGIGMTEAKLSALISSFTETSVLNQKTNNIGLANVYLRVSSFTGRNDSFTITSVEGYSTTVSMRFPFNG